MSKSDDKPKPVPARKPATRSSSGDKKRSGPSMKEKLLAQRRAAEQAAGARPPAGERPAKKPAAPAAAKPGARGTAGARGKAPAGKAPAGKAPAGKASGVRASGVRSKRAGGAGRKEKEKEAAEAGGATAKRGGSHRRHGNRADGDEFVGGGRRDLKPAKRKSPLPFIGIVVVLSAGIFGAVKFLDKGDEASAAETDTSTAAAGAGADALDATGGDAGMGDEAMGAETAAPDPEPEPEPEPVKPKKPKKPISEMTDADYDPMEVSYADIEEFGPADGTTDEEWAEIKRLVVTFTDPDAGAAGNRAGKKLEEMYKEKAFPALVNALMKLDLVTDEGHRTGDVIQKRLQYIANGKNAGWKYEREEWPNRSAKFNRKVVKKLHAVWDRAKDDRAYWIKYANLDEEPPAEEGEAEDELDSLDELDELDDL